MSKNIPALVLLGHFQNDNVKDKTYIMEQHDTYSERDTYEKQKEGLSYYFDSHTCPTNFLGVYAIATVDEGVLNNTDPHGVFSYCSHALLTDEVPYTGKTIGELLSTYDDGTNGIKQMLLSHLLEVEKLHKEKEENEIYGDSGDL